MALLNLVIVLALLATISALGFGLFSMARGGTYDVEHSERFMSARVMFQGIAVLLIIAALFLINVCPAQAPSAGPGVRPGRGPVACAPLIRRPIPCRAGKRGRPARRSRER